MRFCDTSQVSGLPPSPFSSITSRGKPVISATCGLKATAEPDRRSQTHCARNRCRSTCVDHTVPLSRSLVTLRDISPDTCGKAQMLPKNTSIYVTQSAQRLRALRARVKDVHQAPSQTATYFCRRRVFPFISSNWEAVRVSVCCARRIICGW